MHNLPKFDLRILDAKTMPTNFISVPPLLCSVSCVFCLCHNTTYIVYIEQALTQISKTFIALNSFINV